MTVLDVWASGLRNGGSWHQNPPGYVSSPPIEAVIFGWGTNEDAQLGLHSRDDHVSPQVVDALLGRRLQGRGFIRIPIVAGSRNSLAIDQAGNVLMWGWNARGTCGQGHQQQTVEKPRRVHLPEGVQITQAALGGWHCIALDSQGGLWTWGGNEYAQCGYRTHKRDVPVPTRCLPDLPKVRMVAAGGMHSLALLESGEILQWGEPWGDFSLNVDQAPRKLSGLPDPGPEAVTKIACGAFHNLALTGDGRVLSWGTNDYGQLGVGAAPSVPVPEIVSTLEGHRVVDVAAGGWHSAAILEGGELMVWGRGEYGRLGIGDRAGSTKLRPVAVEALQGHVVVQAALGGSHSAVLTESGRVFIWGRGQYGRLGVGADGGRGSGPRDRISPTEVELPGGNLSWRVISIAAGGRHTMVYAVPVQGGDGPGAPESPESSEHVQNAAVMLFGGPGPSKHTAPGGGGGLDGDVSSEVGTGSGSEHVAFGGAPLPASHASRGSHDAASPTFAAAAPRLGGGNTPARSGSPAPKSGGKASDLLPPLGPAKTGPHTRSAVERGSSPPVPPVGAFRPPLGASGFEGGATEAAREDIAARFSAVALRTASPEASGAESGAGRGARRAAIRKQGSFSGPMRVHGRSIGGDHSDNPSVSNPGGMPHEDHSASGRPWRAESVRFQGSQTGAFKADLHDGQMDDDEEQYHQ
ncbi:unnamed protein product [Pedinophyceae sp. YPF-701]|nr:unnamed protein product [Pedinophyceae sp. YPF-701]